MNLFLKPIFMYLVRFQLIYHYESNLSWIDGFLRKSIFDGIYHFHWNSFPILWKAIKQDLKILWLFFSVFSCWHINLNIMMISRKHCFCCLFIVSSHSYPFSGKMGGTFHAGEYLITHVNQPLPYITKLL